MKIEQKPLETCEVQLVVEVDEERVEKAKRAAARRLSQKYNIPGFRKGKAPYEIVVRNFGEGAILEEALDELGQDVYRAALDEAKIEPFAMGSMVDMKLDPVTFTYNVPLKPVVELGDYRSIRLGYSEPELTDEALNNALEAMRNEQAVLEQVERPAAMGDVITLDVKGTLKPVEGEAAGPASPLAPPLPEAAETASLAEAASPPPAASAEVSEHAHTHDHDHDHDHHEFDDDFLMDDKDVDVLLDPKTDWPMLGFAEQVAGMSAGDERRFEMTFADDYPNETLRNRTAVFDVKCTRVQSREVPEWDDELAKSLGDYESLADLRQKTREGLLAVAKRRQESEYSQSAVDVMVAAASIKYPPILLKEEVDGMVEDLDRRLREQRLTLDDYLRIQNLTIEKVREDLEPSANERLRRALVMNKVVELEGLKVTDEEINARLELMSALFGEDGDRYRKVLSSDTGRRSLRLDLLTERSMQRIVAITKGEAPELGEPELGRPELGGPELNAMEIVTEPFVEFPPEAPAPEVIVTTEAAVNDRATPESAQETAPPVSVAAPEGRG